MKNTLKINHTDRTLVMDRTFAKYASDTRSEEYAHLQQIRRDYPDYRVVERHIRRNDEKKTYAGLTYEYMKRYIKAHGTEEEQKKVLEELEEKILISECHGKAYRYPVIKSWFLEKYPEIAKFGLKDTDDDKDEDKSVGSIEDKVTDISAIAPMAKVG